MIETRLDPPRPPVSIVADGERLAVPSGTTLLDALRAAGKMQPTLCYLETLAPINACRVCVVEVAGSRPLVPSCSRAVEDGMEVATDSERVRHSRRLVFELLASSVDLSLVDAATRRWMDEYGVDPARFGRTGNDRAVKIEDDLYVRDYAKCILCYKCVAACGDDAQNTFAIAVGGRGIDAIITTEFDVALPGSACVYCGNCIGVCPTGALMFTTEYELRAAGAWDESRQRVTTTICPYCGVGCNLELHVQDNRVVKVTSPLDHSVTEGHLCIKGRFGFQHLHPDAPERPTGSR